MPLFQDVSNSDAALYSKETARLIRSEEWCHEVLENWPAPIAHELSRLIELLEDGNDIGGTLFQVRDTAEILLKVILAVISADLVANAEYEQDALVGLSVQKISLGGWVQTLRKLIDEKSDAEEQITLDLKNALRKDKFEFFKTYNAYTQYRNQDVGHGAYRRDSLEIAKRIREQFISGDEVYSLSQAFKIIHESGYWKDHKLQIGTSDEISFSGEKAIQHNRSVDFSLEEKKLYLVGKSKSLDLAPFLLLRPCSECGAPTDVFVFDSRHSKDLNDKAKFAYNEYAYGHPTKISVEKNEGGLKDISDRMLNALRNTELTERATLDTAGEFSSKDVERLLQDSLFDYRYRTPKWIRDELAGHIKQNRSGIFWLEAPGHIGKTTFVRGLSGYGLLGKQAERERDVLDGALTLELASLHFHKIYNYNQRSCTLALESILREKFRHASHFDFRLLTEGTARDAQKSFVNFLEQAVAANRSVLHKDHLILALDGLDELVQPALLSSESDQVSSIVDYIPSSDQIPEGVTLLLTSRVTGTSECPNWLKERLGDRLTESENCRRLRAGTDTPGYVNLLKEYTAKHSGYRNDHPEFEKVWDTVYQKSGGLFLFVSFLCDLIKEETGYDDLDSDKNNE